MIPDCLNNYHKKSPCLDVQQWVLAELIPGEDQLIFAESSQVLVRHHPALNQARCEFLEHLQEAQTGIRS